MSGNILCEQYAEFFSGKGVSSTGFPPLQGSLFYTVREIHSIRLYRRDREAARLRQAKWYRGSLRLSSLDMGIYPETEAFFIR